jgi:hypothetical protein
MSEPITVQISQESVQSIVRAKIQTDLLQALSKDRGAEVMLERLVVEALNAKVRKDYREVSFMDDLITNVIQAEARSALQAWVALNKDKIHAAVQKAINKDKALTGKLVDGLLNTVSSAYRIDVGVNVSKMERD